ncbi:hypothetical protein ACOME3_006511 [Neoechinorhynchus agilis]
MSETGGEWKTNEDVMKYLDRIQIEYEYNCFKKGVPEVCHDLGTFYQLYRRKFSSSLAVFEDNCNLRKYGRSCYRAGVNKSVGRACESHILE